MARIGRRGRLWLRSFHIFFVVLWIGALVSQVVILLFSGLARSDGALQAFHAVPQMLNIVTGPGCLGTIVTGALLCWLTPWGFFKHKWIVYTMVVVVLDLVISQIFGEPAVNKMAALAKAEGLGALQNPEYISAWNRLTIMAIVTLLLLISALFVSVMKPWRKRKEAEAAA
jgi:uncharacterized membrane protein